MVHLHVVSDAECQPDIIRARAAHSDTDSSRGPVKVYQDASSFEQWVLFSNPLKSAVLSLFVTRTPHCHLLFSSPRALCFNRVSSFAP